MLASPGRAHDRHNAQRLYVTLRLSLASSAHPVCAAALRLRSSPGPRRVFLQVGRRVFVGSSRHRAAGEQDATTTWLAVEHVDPFAKTRVGGLACLTVQKVFKLIEDHQLCFVDCVQCIKEFKSLILWGKSMKVW